MEVAAVFWYDIYMEYSKQWHSVYYVHILLSIPPKYSISKVVKIFKAKTGLGMRRKFPFLDKVYWGTGGIWSIETSE